MKSLALDSSEYRQKLFWVVKQNDNTIYKQQDINYSDISKSNMKSISIVDEYDNIIITQYFTSDQLPIYRSRTVMKEGVGPIDRVHIVGWLEKNSYHIIYIFESDNHIEVGKTNLPDNPYSSPITLQPEELSIFNSL